MASQLILFAAALPWAPIANGFVIPFPSSTVRNHPSTTFQLGNTNDASTSVEDLLPDKERRDNLFQFLLRDLQVEGVPLLSVDAGQVDALQAALWTTMAELLSSFQTGGASMEKVCLIFESIPVEALALFVDDFHAMQNEVGENLLELGPFQLSLLGRGVGPAIVVQVGEEGKDDSSDSSSSSSDTNKKDDNEKKIVDIPVSSTEYDELKLTAAMKMFVDRIIVPSDDGIGLQPDLASYHVCPFADSLHMLSSFWNCVCELQVSPPDTQSSVVLLLPSLDDHARFASLCHLLSRSLQLYRGDDVLELSFYFPSYNRDEIQPTDMPAFGHLPPTAWLPSIMEQYGEGTKEMNADDLRTVSNYQRRSPVPAVILKRVSVMEEEATLKGASAPSMLTVGQETMTVAGLPLLASSIQTLVITGETVLQEHLEKERSIANETAFS